MRTRHEPTARKIAREAIDMYRRDVEAEDLLREAAQQQRPAQRQQPGSGGAWFGAILFLVVGVLGLWVAQARGYVAVPLPMDMLTPQIQTMTPSARPTPLPYQPAQQYQQAPPTDAPQATAGAIVVVTPTYSTGCHDGVSYVDGVPANGTCAGAAFVGEATAEPTATISPATAVPPDAVYKSTLEQQAPHCIRGCVPTPQEGER